MDRTSKGLIPFLLLSHHYLKLSAILPMNKNWKEFEHINKCSVNQNFHRESTNLFAENRGIKEECCLLQGWCCCCLGNTWALSSQAHGMQSIANIGHCACYGRHLKSEARKAAAFPTSSASTGHQNILFNPMTRWWLKFLHLAMTASFSNEVGFLN